MIFFSQTTEFMFIFYFYLFYLYQSRVTNLTRLKERQVNKTRNIKLLNLLLVLRAKTEGWWYIDNKQFDMHHHCGGLLVGVVFRGTNI